tara:strand:- start:650 stop:1495 length:846 start_codon:yes stop_codon:yes gene_type:complete
MFKNLMRYLYYSLLDILRIIKNLISRNTFIILSPRILSLILKKVLIFDKKNKFFFYHNVRNYSDILTVHEIFSDENYNLSILASFDHIKKEYEEILKSKSIPLIIDCGSNIGSSSLYFSKIFNRSQIVLIEPDNKSFEFSKKNIKYQNTIFLNKVIDSEKKNVNFFSDPDDNRKSKVSKEGVNIVKSITINEIVEKLKIENKVPFLIKIDIEGYENQLFSKNYDWIDKFKIIIIEIHDWMIPNKYNSFNFLNALVENMKINHKRDLIISGENLISIRIDEH